ncbi:MAG: hypothetical protein KA285_09020, partial [Bacteroidia bacterium]|nr:hypothetical protein [Bacteroidia bacterium]
MKNLFKLFLVLVVCSSPVFAQNKIDKIDLTYGAELPDDKHAIVKIIGEVSGKIYALAMNKDDYYIRIFDSKEMKQLSMNKIIQPELEDKDVDFEDIFLLNDKLYVVGSVYNRKEKIFNLMGTQIGENGIMSPTSTKMFEAEVAKKSARGAFYFKISPDGGALLAMHTCEFSKEDAVKYQVKLFDNKLDVMFDHKEDVFFNDSKKDYEFMISDFEISYDDDVLLVINESYRDNKKKEQVEKFEIHEFMKANSYKKEVVNINLKDVEIINCKMMSTAQNTLKLVGFYSSVRESGRANKELKGVYNATMDLSSKASPVVKFNEFDLATKVKLMGERRANKGKDVKPLYAITNIIEKEDGGMIIMSEYQTIIVGKTQGLGPFSVTPITYTRNEIIITSLNPDGKVAWSNVLPKEQSATVSEIGWSTGTYSYGAGSFGVGVYKGIPLGTLGKGPEYLGSIPIYSNGKLNVVFNDNIKNKGIIDIEEVRTMGNYKSSVPALFIFEENGKLSRKDPE